MDLTPIINAIRSVIDSLPEDATVPRVVLTVALFAFYAWQLFRPVPIGNGETASLMQQAMRPYVEGVGLGKVSTMKAVQMLASVAVLFVTTFRMTLLDAAGAADLLALAGVGVGAGASKSYEDRAAAEKPPAELAAWTDADAHTPAA